jgi:phospholipid/cholesterol/gamma-HCH transport system permease protein
MYGWAGSVNLSERCWNFLFFTNRRSSAGVGIVKGDPTLERIAQGNSLALSATGPWIARFASELEQIVSEAERLRGKSSNIFIDVSRVSKLDTFGAWLIERLRRSLTQGGVEAKIAGLSADYSSLVDEVRRVKAIPAADVTSVTVTGILDQVGRTMAGIGGTVLSLVDMLGAVLAASFRVLIHPRSFRLTSTVHHMEQVCWRAVPIVVLITFLIGCIISQQGIFHFRRFGADIFVVDMLGVLVLREIGVLLVAIMVAGRSGSAYTAELGSMKMREEIDALRTMGFDPIEVLILPRMLALVLALPILAFLGAIAALYGGGLVAWLYGGVDPEAFLLRLRDAISIDHFTVGIIKAPVMAAVIGIVACVEGLAVQGSAESLGQHTTSSVVKGIFFVIVMDGVFAIFFASIGM